MMSSTAWEPLLGSSLTLLVSSVELYPEQPLVRLWGSLEEKCGEYQRLRADMQAAAPALPRGVEHGGFGDWYLMEMGGQWHRCRLLSPPGPELLSVFLLDQGRTAGPVSSKNLARCPEPFLRLAPELLCCVLANLAPADRHRWSPAAAEFFYSQRGKRLRGLVREVLPQQRLLVLEVQTLNRQMQELGLALTVPDNDFHQTCLPQLGFVRPAQVEPPVHRATVPEPSVALDYFYPLLQIGGVEPVLVTEVLDPFHLFCQLRSLSQEVQRLSDSMYQYYEVRQQGQALHGALAPETPGQPFAARGADGRWYRTLLRQVFADRDMPEVTHVDYGRRERVPRTCLRPLLAEYFRMPVVTYACALFGVSENSSGCWSQKQIHELRTLLLGKLVNARIEYYNTNEHLYFVTLYSQDGQDLNSLYSIQAHRPEEVAVCEGQMRKSHQDSTQSVTVATQKKGTKTAEQRAIISKAGDSCSFGRRSASEVGVVETSKGTSKSRSHSKSSSPVTNEDKATTTKPAQISAFTVRRELKINAFYDAVIDSIHDPSEFWLRAGEQESLQFSHLMTCLSHHYSQLSKVEKIIMQPQPGQICCIKFNTHYHRATVVAVQGKIVKVYCLDTGATEDVDWYDVKELELQFKDVPPFAIRCCLADVIPQENKWSQAAIDYFKMNVLNKGLVIHVLAKEDDKYVIEVLDESREGVRNISKIIAHAGYAIYQEFVPSPPAPVQDPVKITSKVKQVVKKKVYTENHAPTEVLGKLSVGQPPKRNDQFISSTIMLNHPTAAQSLGKQKTPPKPPLKDKPESSFQGQSFDIGSVFEVQVTHIETPGMFWCQIVRARQELKVLMARIQAYCSNCAPPYEWNNSACLAKYSEDGKWYRAVITSEVCMDGVKPKGVSYVDVDYVDFGNKESVSVNDLRSITGEFLQIKSQAFQCSLYNRIQPIGNEPFVWIDEAVASFEEFVNANHIELNCTIYAVASLHNERFHVVDLTTPFHSVCQQLIDHGFAKPRQQLDPSVHLCSYYYSTHGIKIGSEEEVFVTHVEKPCEFYCQLEKNACTLEQLSSTVNMLGKSAKHLHNSETIQGLCLAKYTDEQWYRGMLRGTTLNQEVIFVDFGNKEKVLQKELCPVPDDAYDVLLPPVQAIKCGLSDIPTGITEPVAMWFEKAVLANSMKAIVVAKEVDGKLLVELYDGTVQINAQIKEKLGMACVRDLKKSIPTAEKMKPLKMREERTLSTHAKRADEKKVLSECKDHLVNKSTLVNKPEDREFSNRLPQEEQFAKKSRHPQGDGWDSLSLNSNKSLEGKVCHKLDTSGKQKLQGLFPPNINKAFDSVRSTLGKPTFNSDLPQRKLHNLPHKNVVPALKIEVYISHINDPSDFYVQFVEDDTALATISEKLNEGSCETESLQESRLQAGDLVSALFPDDCSWYRAFLKARMYDGLHVQYIDYGNTAIIDASETKALPHDTLSIPALSIHCSLWGIESTSFWTPEVVGCFSEKTTEQVACEFVQLHGGKWDIRLFDAQGIIINDLINDLVQKSQSQEIDCHNEIEFHDCVNILSKSVLPNSSKVSDVGNTLYKWKTNEIGDIVKAYAVTVESPDYFWCQCAETEDIDILARKVQEAGDRLGQKDDHTTFQSGEPCIVKYSEDEQWYRAVIKCPAEDRWMVTFVDYGNEETVNREAVRAIPADLLTIPVQAFPCCLWGFDAARGLWTSEAVGAFNEIVVLDKLDVTVMEFRPNEELSEVPLSLVKLECNGKNLNNEMRFWHRYPSELCTQGSEGISTETLEMPMVVLSPFALSTDVGSSLTNNESQLVIQPQSVEVTDRVCNSEYNFKENISIQSTDQHSCSSQPLEDKALYSPVTDEISPENGSITKSLKENDSSDKWFVPGSETLSEESTLHDVPNIISVDVTETMASLFHQLPKDTSCIVGQMTQEYINPEQDVPGECLWRKETDVLSSDSFNRKEAAVGELPFSLVLPEEPAYVNKQAREDYNLQDSPNASLLGEGTSALKYAGPDSYTLHGINTVNDALLVPFEIVAKTGCSVGDLEEEKEFDQVSPDTVYAPDLQKEPVRNTVGPPSDSLQGGRSSFMQDTLANSVLIQKRRFLPIPDTVFVEESEISSCNSKIEPQSEQRDILVIEDAAGDLISEKNTVKCQSDVVLEEVDKPVVRNILEEQSGQEALDCCIEGALENQEHHESERVSQTETNRAEMQLEHALYEDIFKSRMQESLSSLKMSDEDSRIERLEEEDSLLELDTGQPIFCWGHQITTSIPISPESNAVYSSVREDQESPSVCLDEELLPPIETLLDPESKLASASDTYEESPSVCLDEELLPPIETLSDPESKLASASDTYEESPSVCLDEELLPPIETLSDPESKLASASDTYEEVTSVTLGEEMLAVIMDSVAEGKADSTRDTDEEMSSRRLKEGTLVVQDKSPLQTRTSNSTARKKEMSSSSLKEGTLVAQDKSRLQTTTSNLTNKNEEMSSSSLKEGTLVVKDTSPLQTTTSKSTDRNLEMSSSSVKEGTLVVQDKSPLQTMTSNTMDRNKEMSSSSLKEGTLVVLDKSPLRTMTSNTTDRNKGIILDEDLPVMVPESKPEIDVPSSTHTVEGLTLNEDLAAMVPETNPEMDVPSSMHTAEGPPEALSTSTLNKNKEAGLTLDEDLPVMLPESNPKIDVPSSSHTAEGLTLEEELPVTIPDAYPGSKMASTTDAVEGPLPQNLIGLSAENQMNLLCTCPEEAHNTHTSSSLTGPLPQNRIGLSAENQRNLLCTCPKESNDNTDTSSFFPGPLPQNLIGLSAENRRNLLCTCPEESNDNTDTSSFFPGPLPQNRIGLSAENQRNLLCTCPEESNDSTDTSSFFPVNVFLLDEELPVIPDANLERRSASPTHTVEEAVNRNILTAENQMLMSCTCQEQVYDKTDSSSPLGETVPEDQIFLNTEDRMSLSCTCPEEAYGKPVLQSYSADEQETAPEDQVFLNTENKMSLSCTCPEEACDETVFKSYSADEEETAPEEQVYSNAENKMSLSCTYPEEAYDETVFKSYSADEQESGSSSAVNMDCHT
ncbi:tudor domain-containing protein 6 isoform X4 [Lissotriton helveticus]